MNKTEVFEGKFSFCDVARETPQFYKRETPSIESWLYNTYAKILIQCTNPGSFYFLFAIKITWIIIAGIPFSS